MPEFGRLCAMEEHRYIERVVQTMPNTFSKLERLLVADDDVHVILWLRDDVLITKDKLPADALRGDVVFFRPLMYVIDVTGEPL